MVLDHNYARKPYKIKFPPYFAYADDVDFICDTQEEADDIVKRATAIFRTFNLFINPDKTEFTKVAPSSTHPDALRGTKKLGSLLDEDEDIDRRKNLSNAVLLKLRTIWKNRFIRLKVKLSVYKIFVESILYYNCGTWATNKEIERKIDIIQRKQLRTVMDIHWPKTVSNIQLYTLTKQTEASQMVAGRRKSLLGHALRRDNAASETLLSIVALDEVTARARGRRNILKTVTSEIGPLQNLRIDAIARKF